MVKPETLQTVRQPKNMMPSHYSLRHFYTDKNLSQAFQKPASLTMLFTWSMRFLLLKFWDLIGLSSKLFVVQKLS